MATLTVRLDERRARRVAEAARRSGRTVSDIVREALDMALTDRPISARAGHVKGRLALDARRQVAWSNELRDHNWRP